MNNKVIIYQAKSGAIELKGDIEKETVWATQEQIAEIFGIERSVITKHIRNILNDGELKANSVCAKYARTAKDEKTYQVQAYNLDIILAIGYRTNSARAIQFRQWATKTLRQYIQEGYVLNKKQIAKNYHKFLAAVDNIRKLVPVTANVTTDDVLDLIQLFASTWFSLDAYDKDQFSAGALTKRKM